METLDISPQARQYLIDEFKYAVIKMKDEYEPLDKLFYYSAAYGAIQRVFNQEYHPLLVHLHMILQVSYSTINNKVQEIVRGIEKVIKIPENYFEILEEMLDELIGRIENYQEIESTLKKITNHTYIMVGNGYYLFKKGVLKI